MIGVIVDIQKKEKSNC